jgi:hypothetical protein
LSGDKLTLAVDSDGRVFSFLVANDQKIRSKMTIGFESTLPSEFPFASSIPKEEVILSLHRLTLQANGPRIWISRTIGLSRDSSIEGCKVFRLTEYLYVFKDSAKGREQLLRKAYPRILDLDFDDVNGDGAMELAAHYEGGGVSFSGFLDIWRIDKNGFLKSR